jgi:hypothetical protein
MLGWQDHMQDTTPFHQRVPQARLNESFKQLRNLPGYAPAKAIIQEHFASFPDTDGNFVEQFQSSGFDSRLWELYLFISLSELGFAVDRPYDRPDFRCRKGDSLTVWLEAVTVNPSQASGDVSQVEAKGLPLEPRDILRRNRDFVPIKYGSPLTSKLRQEYWKLDHVEDLPLVLAIADFHGERSMMWTTTGLMTYLYGFRHDWRHDDRGHLHVEPLIVGSHRLGSKEIPSGFFFLPGAENMSAVLFSNSGTISKFNRMGWLAGHTTEHLHMIRQGTCYNHDPDAVAPLLFQYEIGDPDYPESWAQGLNMYHNPRALHPILYEALPGIAHHTLRNGLMVSEIPHFHPMASHTVILHENLGKRGEQSLEATTPRGRSS